MDIKTAKIHIIGGTGNMGNWVKNFLLSKNIVSTISGRSTGQENIKTADLIFISVPISVSDQIISDTTRQIKKTSAIINMSSVMESNEELLSQNKNPSCCIHFLFGPNISSVQNQKIIVNTIRDSSLISEFISLLETENAHMIKLDGKTHDLQMAHIQSLTHFVNLVAAKVFIEDNIDLAGKISTPVFLSQISTLNRVVSQNPDLLSEIQLTNPYTMSVIDKFTKYQKEIMNLIERKDKTSLTLEYAKIHQKLEPKRIDTKTKFEKENKIIDLKNAKVAFLGPAGTFSYQALTLFTKNFQPIPCSSIVDIFKTISVGRADFGIVPAENSTEGTVRETFDYLVDFNLFTNVSFKMQIHQNLLSKESNIHNIAKIISHPQALGQTKSWISQNLPEATLENAPSTLSALERGLSPKEAIIGPIIASEIYSLNILAKDIEDNQDNATIFYLVSKSNRTIRSSKKTLLFFTIFNRVGILRDILDVFAQFNMDLSKIESRPTKNKIWDYHFFLEVTVSQDDEKLIQALNVLKQYCPAIKILGST